MLIDYDIPTIEPYINWSYFYYAWQVKDASQRDALRREAEDFLHSISTRYKAHTVFRIVNAHSDGDDIVIDDDNERLALLRQQSSDSQYLCLSDFIHPQHDRLGLFATSVDVGMETDFDSDPYAKMMAQLLADRLAEAATERMHEEVRKNYWGYAKEENLSIPQLHSEHFQGIRPAVGYPSLPDSSINFQLDRLLGMKQVGIRLTESGAMHPHASVSGLMISHPASHYFSIGVVGDDQLRDYARRRSMPVEMARKFLASNLQ